MALQDNLDTYRNEAIDFLFNVDILKDNTYVYDESMVQGGLEYEDLEFCDINTVFTIDDFTVYQFDGELREGGTLIINFNGKYEETDEESKKFYEKKYSSLITSTDNIKMMNFFPLRTTGKAEFLDLFHRTEFNGIINMDYLARKLYEIYIKPAIGLIKPEKIVILDKELQEPIDRLDSGLSISFN
ncbi:MAG: hypothetical protein QXZ44_02930 [Ferroplasma sp.]